MKIPRPWLVPLNPFYAFGVYLWETCYRIGVFPTRKLTIPVISVGNITSGGSGKTPMVIRLAQHALSRGKRPGILSRGYGGTKSRSSIPFVFLGKDLPLAEEVGDEPAMMAGKLPEGLFGICPDRVLGGLALQNAGADLIILDDGFQSLELFQDLQIVFVPDEMTGGCSGSLLHWLPAGDLRDFPSRLSEGDILAFIDKKTEGESPDFLKQKIEGCLEAMGISQKGQVILGARLTFSGIVGTDFNPKETLEDLRGKNSVVVSGIARPERFEQFLRTLGIEPVAHLILKDHVSYSARRIQEIGEWISSIEKKHHIDRILTTEKDLVKWACSPDPDKRLRGISVEMDWLEPAGWIREIDRVLGLTPT
ncbi:MAG: tetraacyldisaccharide 4'-kinase [Leptospirales bacterium]